MATAPPLPEEIIEEVLLRFPPDDPATLVRAALVSKRWRGLVSGRGFRRRFRELHRSPPLLGFLCNSAVDAHFVPTSSFHPPHAPRRRGLRAVHSGHGRVLLHQNGGAWADLFVVWDPITGAHLEFPMGPPCLRPYPQPKCWNAAVVCAASAGGGCSHLDCRHGPFLVVLVGTTTFSRRTFFCVYSSETGEWSNPSYPSVNPPIGYFRFEPGKNSELLGSVLYFKCHMSTAILKYDLATQEMSLIQLPKGVGWGATLMATMDGGRLGFAVKHSARLYMWSREHGPDGEAEWTRSRVIDLSVLIPFPMDAIAKLPQVAGFAQIGAGVVFMWTRAGFFTIDLKSGSSNWLGESCGFARFVVPYISFCTPALDD